MNLKNIQIKKVCLNNFAKNSYGDDKPFFNEELIKGIKSKHQEYIYANTKSFTVKLFVLKFNNK